MSNCLPVAMSTLGYIYIPSFRFGFDKFAINVTVSFCYNSFFSEYEYCCVSSKTFLNVSCITFCNFLNVYIFGDFYHYLS